MPKKSVELSFRMNILRSLLLVLMPLLYSVGVLAQPKQPSRTESDYLKVQKISGINNPSIPEPQNPDGPLVIDKERISDFYDLLLAPIATWVDKGWITVRASSRTEFDWSYGSQWERQSVANSSYQLEEDGSLYSEDLGDYQGGFPFGRSDSLDDVSDPEERARKILWNTISTGAVSEDLLYGVDISWLTYSARKRKASAILDRQTGIPLKSRQQDDPLLARELFLFLTPPVVFGYSQVLTQYLNSTDDEIWHYSPVVGKGRKIFPANRGDGIIGSVLTPDDFFVWSGKVQSVKASVLDSKRLLIPVPTLKTHGADKERVAISASNFVKPLSLGNLVFESQARAKFEEVETVRGNLIDERGNEVFVKLNGDTRVLKTGASWMLSSVQFIPRDTWIIEIESQNPYRVGGREILVVDKGSMLPIYKIVYDQAGQYLRTVVGVWTLGLGTTEKTKRFPFLASVLVVDGRSREAALIETTYVQTFYGRLTEASKELRSLLKPKRLVQLIAPEEKEEKSNLPSKAKEPLSASGSTVPTGAAKKKVKPKVPKPILKKETGVERLPKKPKLPLSDLDF